MIKNSAFVLLFVLAISKFSFSANDVWQAPKESSKNKNKVELTPRTVANGKNIFSKTCIGCHGRNADGKGLVQSANLVTDTFQRQTDGDIFFKINTGRNKMPSFSAMLKEEEVWSVINYLRVLVNPKLVPPAKNVKFSVVVNPEFKSITAFVTSVDSAKLPLPEVDVHFYVKRDFGMMRFGETSNLTNKEGKISINFPDKIIGDKDGNIVIIAKVENNFIYNDTAITLKQKWGKPLITKDELFEQRSLWSNRDKSPVWLLLLANGIIIAVWGVIVYVIFSLIRIKKAGKIFLK